VQAIARVRVQGSVRWPRLIDLWAGKASPPQIPSKSLQSAAAATTAAADGVGAFAIALSAARRLADLRMGANSNLYQSDKDQREALARALGVERRSNCLQTYPIPRALSIPRLLSPPSSLNSSCYPHLKLPYLPHPSKHYPSKHYFYPIYIAPS
jgi:hypothetical protein